MANEIPISKVRPTHSSIKMVKFTNIDVDSDDDFVHAVGGKRVRFKKGKSFMLPETLAVHFAKNLAHKIIFRDDASLMKYAKIDAKKDRETTAKGESPLMLPVGKESVNKLMQVILNGHQVHQVPMGDEIVDASEIGMPVSEQKSDEKVGKKNSKKSKKDVHAGEAAGVPKNDENDEELDDDFEDLGNDK